MSNAEIITSICCFILSIISTFLAYIIERQNKDILHLHNCYKASQEDLKKANETITKLQCEVITLKQWYPMEQYDLDKNELVLMLSKQYGISIGTQGRGGYKNPIKPLAWKKLPEIPDAITKIL